MATVEPVSFKRVCKCMAAKARPALVAAGRSSVSSSPVGAVSTAPAANPEGDATLLIVGLTGGIATGKSTVARRLQELGAVVIDADRIACEVVEPGEPALEEIRARFGPGVIGPDGRLDRALLGRIVFSDARARKDLEAIIHPACAQQDARDDRAA